MFSLKARWFLLEPSFTFVLDVKNTVAYRYLGVKQYKFKFKIKIFNFNMAWFVPELDLGYRQFHESGSA